MKTLRAMLILLAMLPFAACDSTGKTTPATFGVTLERVEFTAQPDDPALYNYRAYLRFTRAQGYSGVVSEVRRNGSLVAVEYFDLTQWEWANDIQADFIGNSRTVTTYPADVTGAVLVNGFAMIEGTPYPLQINQLAMPAGYVPAGTITRSDPSRAVTWTLDAGADGVTVFLNGETRFFHR